MSVDADEYAGPDRPGTPDGRPPRRWWLAAVSAVIVVVAIVAGVAGLGSDDSTEEAGGAPSTSASSSASPDAAASASAGPSPTRQPTPGRDEPTGEPSRATQGTLQLPAAQGRCMVPTAKSLRTWPMAFEATVTQVDDRAGTVLLKVERWYTAEGFGGTDTIMVTEPPQGITETQLVFREGRDYLVAAGQDATVALCGFSGPRTQELTALYEQAFG